MSGDGRERRQLDRPFGEPQMLALRPGAMVTLTPESFLAARALMLVGTPGIELQRRPVVGADSTVHRQQRLDLGNHRRACEDWSVATLDVITQSAEIVVRANLRAAGGEAFGGDHEARPPSPVHWTGSTVAPTPRAAATAPAVAPGSRKNIDPPAPAPAAFPPSAFVSRITCSNRAVSSVCIPPSKACCHFQFSPSNVPTRDRSPARSASAIASATSFIACSAPTMVRSFRS